jgi:hypothetical protein
LESRRLLASNSATLPNGADLTVSIDDPVTSTEFLVPVGQPTIDVEVQGTASIGLGEPDATFVYIMDVSGSTDVGSGTGCSPVLDCEQKFVVALNDAVVTSGQADEAGLVVFADSAATADMSPAGGDQLLTTPDAGPGDVTTVIDSTFSVFGGNGGVAQFTNKVVGNQTNCTAGLEAALTVVNASSNGTNVGVMVSDGQCDDSGGGGLAAFNAAIAALNSAGAVINTVATGLNASGDPNSCTDTTVGFDGTLQDIADGTGGMCFEVADPGNLPDIIPELIGATLDSLEIEVDGGGQTPISNDDIDPDLPLPAADTASYSTTVLGLGPGDHVICVTANGSDVTGGTASVTQCETIHLLQLEASPATETNELGLDNMHTVTATVVGDPAYVSANPRVVDFDVSGQNAGATGTCSPNPDCSTDAAGQVSFTYSVPVEPDSLGTDTIRVSTIIAGQETFIDLEKEWVDTTPPVPSCTESVNPHGQNTPPAGSTTLPGPKGGQNEDGFYLLSAEDDVWPAEDLEIFVNGFGPFAVDDVIKYTQDDDAVPEMKPIGSGNGQAGAVAAHIIGNGDASVTAVDGSGNVSEPILCLVPPLPKRAEPATPSFSLGTLPKEPKGISGQAMARRAVDGTHLPSDIGVISKDAPIGRPDKPSADVVIIDASGTGVTAVGVPASTPPQSLWAWQASSVRLPAGSQLRPISDGTLNARAFDVYFAAYPVHPFGEAMEELLDVAFAS